MEKEEGGEGHCLQGGSLGPYGPWIVGNEVGRIRVERQSR